MAKHAPVGYNEVWNRICKVLSTASESPLKSASKPVSFGRFRYLFLSCQSGLLGFQLLFLSLEILAQQPAGISALERANKGQQLIINKNAMSFCFHINLKHLGVVPKRDFILDVDCCRADGFVRKRDWFRSRASSLILRACGKPLNQHHWISIIDAAPFQHWFVTNTQQL